tara:strand:- start:1553 stop:2152 length:600 start_codon:yes stop_codon:yes gene_type:complete
MPSSSEGNAMNAMLGAGAGAAGAMVVGILYFMIMVFLIVYVLGHVRRKQGQKHDPFLGSKVMLTLFMSLCFQVVLLGLAAILVIASMKQSPKGATDLPLGLMLGAIVAGIFPTVLFFAGIRGRGSADVGRKALGINAIVTGLFSTFGIMALFVMALMDQNVVKVLLFTMVYLLAFIGCGLPLVIGASRRYTAEHIVAEE